MNGINRLESLDDDSMGQYGTGLDCGGSLDADSRRNIALLERAVVTIIRRLGGEDKDSFG
jgi:hypothetical protein